MADKDNAASNKRKENLMRYNPSIISPDGQFSASSMTSSSVGRMSLSNAMWDKLPGTQHFGFNDIGVHHGTSMPNVVGTRPIDVGWTPPNTMLKGDIFAQDADDGFLHPSLAHIPTDSGFIERATRYSCFSGGNFGDIANPLSIPESAYLNMAGSSNCVGLLGECKGTRQKNDKASENMERSIDKQKLCGSDASNDSDEAEYSSPGGEDELKIADKDYSSKGVVASKKRKRSGQDAEMDQGRVVSDKLVEDVKDHTKLKQKGKQIPTSTCGKPGGENAKKYGPGASDKVEYVHVRAPRGQATNSHSLAERIRREKISERMKFLQDIVPGCSKVTGKAVMLDEIINYVQSLQLQIEFLSMKLATLNPRVDTNAERLVLTEDILQSRGTPSPLAFPPIMSMGYPTLHQSQGIVQTLGSSWDVLRRSMNSSLTAMDGGYNKEHSSHVSSTWEDELHNVVHMGSSSTAPLSSQDISDHFMCRVYQIRYC